MTIDNETGLLIPPGDPDSLARAIAKLIADPDLRARFGENGRIHALKHFTLDVFDRRFRSTLRHGAFRKTGHDI